MKKLFAILISFHLIVAPVAIAQDAATTPEISGEAATQMLKEKTATSMGGYGFYANQILALAIGVIGSNILKKCTMGGMQPSVVVFMAASLGYIAMEIWAAAEQKSVHNKSADELKLLEENRLKSGEFQVETLRAARENEMASKRFLEIRAGLTTALAAAFTAASILAIYEYVASLPPPPSGPGQNKSAGAACTGYAEGDSGILVAAIAAAFSAATGIGDMFNGGGGGPAGTAFTLVKSGLSLVVGQLDKTSVIYEEAIPRAITFGASAVLTGTLAVSLGVNAGVATENIGKLNKSVEYMENTPKNTSNITPGSGNGVNLDYNNTKNQAAQGRIDANPMKSTGMAEVRRCLSQKNGAYVSSTDCKSPVKVPVPPPIIGLNDKTLANAITSTVNFSQAAVNGDRAGVQAESMKLSAMANRLKQMKEEAYKMANNELKKAGKKEVNFQQESEKQVAAMYSDLKSGLAKQGIDLASLEKPVGKEKADTKKIEMPGQETAALPVSEELPTLTPEDDDVNAEVAQALNKEQSFDQYESTVQDISKRPEVSIFKQLSNRYLLNYGRILEEEKKK